MKESKEFREFRFRNTKENGALAGTTLSAEVPVFDWDRFKSLPNAELFVRRACSSLLQKLVRDIELGNRNGTSKKDFLSLEAVITRSFTFKKSDIARWCEQRDWSYAKLRNPAKGIPFLKKTLPEYASNDYAITDEEIREKVAEFVAAVSDREKDDIAEYLWVKLTQKLPEPEDTVLLALL